MALEVGQHAPEFSLYDTDRKLRKLSEFKGKNVVLAFFPGTFTGTCTKEMCTLRDQHSQYNTMNAQVIGITVDSAHTMKAWAEQNKVTYPFLSDFKREVVTQFGVANPNMGGMEGYTTAKRSVFVLDKTGVVRYKWVAEAPGEPNYDEVKAAVGKLPK
ncbi:MAG: peroxiredoxin [Dehalococcoidia bacterium]|nr:peroxiredoxin [Dehalococcoidia bacterium]MSQ17557.1 peroxiredoxin [Dehalococcoidia bacterium]